MPKTDVWPYEVHSQNEKGINFKQVSLTVDEANPAKDGVSKAGYDYHLPPRVSFVEDPQREDWMWKAWDDNAGRYADYEGALPVPGDVVQVKLKVSYKNGEDSGEYYYDVHDLYLSLGSAAGTPVSDSTQAPAPASGGSNLSALGRLSTQEQIAATAMTNNLGLAVFDATPDGDEWKETIREAVKKILTSQIPPSLLDIAKAGAEDQYDAAPAAPEPEPEQTPLPADPMADDDVEELPW